jgi:uncharacterized delta-60 repeat protein
MHRRARYRSSGFEQAAMSQQSRNCSCPISGRQYRILGKSSVLLTLWLVCPLAAWSQGGHREAVLVVGDVATALAVQADGKLVVAGVSDNNSTLVRYNPDGTLDSHFGTEGRIPPHAGMGIGISALAIQEDGKIVVTGVVYTSMGSNDFAVARYKPDGRLDPAFGTGGRVTTDLSGDYDIPFALAIQKDGKIVVAGAAVSDFALVRYNPNGSLDSGFEVGGKVITPMRSIGARALALQPDGKIIVVGIAEGSFALARYNPDGSLDSSFGKEGKVTTRIGAGVMRS